MANRRLLLISPGFAANEEDQSCIPPLQLLVSGFLAQGIDVQVIALEYPFQEMDYSWHTALVRPCGGRNQKWRRMPTLFHAYTKGMTWAKQHQEDSCAVLSCWLGWASFVGERLAERCGLRHYTILMGQDVLPGNRFHLANLRPYRQKRLIAVSEYQRQVLMDQTGQQAGFVIPWGISPPDQLPDTKRKPLILGVGSLISLKNWQKWLQTLAIFLPGQPEFKAILVGNGPERKALESYCRELGLDHQVSFAGALPRQEVLALMQQSTVLLHTSAYESFGFVLVEALVHGMAVVSTPTGVAPMLGIPTASRPEELAKALEKVLFVPLLQVSWPDEAATAQQYIKVLFP